MYKVGDIVNCFVTGFKEYGIFVKVDNDYNGLIHISEISSSILIITVKVMLKLDEKIYAKVIEVDNNTKLLKIIYQNN